MDQKANLATIICPYLDARDISNLFVKCLKYPYKFERDQNLIGPDMMYERLWNQCSTDIIILHADMDPQTEDWYEQFQLAAQQFPEAGIIGAKLLYPAQDQNGKFFLQSAGGKFVDNRPDHFGSGLDLTTSKVWKTPELDEGQYDFVREVAWTTFGGVYIRREVLNQIGNFDRSYEWSYNRDVDYCLKARQAGWKIYQIPIPIIHYESRDVKRIRTQKQLAQEASNLQILQNKWLGTEWYQTLDERIENGN